MALVTERRGPASVAVNDDDELIAEITGASLMNLRFRPGGSFHVSPELPIPLHWRQYANHQDPERNASKHSRVDQVRTEEGRRVIVSCTGRNASESIESTTTVEILRLSDPVRYEIAVRTALRVREGSSWLVTPNRHHGELEFCTLFPTGTFHPRNDRPKRYQACFIEQGRSIWRVPHHHLESADKHNIPLRAGNRFFYLLEDENLCLEFLGDHPALAGLCAYMWDGHFAYGVCNRDEPVNLSGGSFYEAAYRLSAVGREEGTRIVGAAIERPAPGIEEIPLYTTKMNCFERTGASASMDPANSWPWEFECAESGDASQGELDRSVGFDDHYSLRISGRGPETARWIATTIGPAFGAPEFHDQARFSLECAVRTRSLSAGATIALRLHRSGAPGLYDPSSYELFRAREQATGDSEWMRLEVLTPPISPPPDRIHILLEHRGSGTSWFDNVLLQEHA